jgi:hypothetical protein
MSDCEYPDTENSVEIETDRDRRIWDQGHEQGWNGCLFEWQQQDTKPTFREMDGGYLVAEAFFDIAFTVDGAAWFFRAPRDEIVGPFESIEAAWTESCYPLDTNDEQS